MEQLYEGVQLNAPAKVYHNDKRNHIRKWFLCFILLLVAALFLPWTQNIRVRGKVTALRPEQRPQQVNTLIAGRVVKWHVKEGDMVKAGDTLLQIAEIKDDYLDPQLADRTRDMISAKQNAVGLYRNKAGTANSQVNALLAGRDLKLSQLSLKSGQLQMKLRADSAEAAAAGNDYNIARVQYDRQKKMYEEGLVSLTQLEQRNQAMQGAGAKKIVAENKLANTRQDLLIVSAEISGVQQDFLEKASKAQGDGFQSLSQAATGESEILKLQNQETNYRVRNGMYYILAPQNGQIVQLKKAGIGEVVKEGEQIGWLVPEAVNRAVEIFVRPIDMPLLDTGQKVRFVFDGYPAIIFSGWPGASYGTFGGVVVAMEHTVGEEGLFRVLVAEDTTVKKWPTQLRIGTGAKAIALLKDVPVWYELWRNINGFPPDYYRPSNTSTKKSK